MDSVLPVVFHRYANEMSDVTGPLHILSTAQSLHTRAIVLTVQTPLDEVLNAALSYELDPLLIKAAFSNQKSKD